jgi:hypothetical protein
LTCAQPTMLRGHIRQENLKSAFDGSPRTAGIYEPQPPALCSPAHRLDHVMRHGICQQNNRAHCSGDGRRKMPGLEAVPVNDPSNSLAFQLSRQGVQGMTTYDQENHRQSGSCWSLENENENHFHYLRRRILAMEGKGCQAKNENEFQFHL